MLRGIRLLACMMCVAGAAGLTGCAESIYPSLPKLEGLTGPVLSPAEQEDVINDMTAEQKAHEAQAAEDIERRE